MRDAAPLMPSEVIEPIRVVADATEAGRRAPIRLKCNSLTDPDIVERLE